MTAEKEEIKFKGFLAKEMKIVKKSGGYVFKAEKKKRKKS